MSRPLNPEQIASLVFGDARDPFALLGLHADPATHNWQLCVFDPHAEAIEMVDPRGGMIARLRQLDVDGETADEQHPGCGVWVARGPLTALKGLNGRYKLRLHRYGSSRDVEDPYRFGPYLGELDCHLLAEGNHWRAYEKLGAHPLTVDGVAGTAFAVWAPNARRVSVVGDFNDWDGRLHPMRLRSDCGVWEIFVPGVAAGALYKFEIKAADGTLLPLKFDPCAFYAEQRPATASVVHGLSDFAWNDSEWLKQRQKGGAQLAEPMSIYEVHLGSWRRRSDEGNRFLTYRELAAELVPYVKSLGFTHIELLPIHEHPFDGSWGYQPIGLYAPTSRFGTPDDFKAFVDACHQAGLGVIIDWVPGHFPKDTHGLVQFDGTHLYEHADPRQGEHMDWGTLIYNFGRTEVRNFLIANALYWIDQFHIDGLRVDAVASMLYLDYSRKYGEWVPNHHGGNENLEAVEFLKRLNEVVYSEGFGAITIAEESTSWPMVSRPTYLGGLGFGYKWNMGWMHDTLTYFSKDPIHRRFHHNQLTFGLLYAFSENFCLPLSHDEVVHGKGSLYGRMAGDPWQKLANLRAYFAFMWAHPGKKLLFMGGELAQPGEWNFDEALPWGLLAETGHAGMQRLVAVLNHGYTALPALYEQDFDHNGFAWIDCQDSDNSVISWARFPRSAGARPVVVICNLTPVVRQEYRIGLPRGGRWECLLNTDDAAYGGSGVRCIGARDADGREVIHSDDIPFHGQPVSISLTLPPLATVWLSPAD